MRIKGKISFRFTSFAIFLLTTLIVYGENCTQKGGPLVIGNGSGGSQSPLPLFSPSPGGSPNPSSAPVLGSMNNSCTTVGSNVNCTATWSVQNATSCVYGTTALAVNGGVTAPFNFSYATTTGPGFVGASVLSCTGPGGMTEANFVADCPPNGSSCNFSGPYVFSSAAPAPVLGALTMVCNTQNCVITYQVQNASYCFIPDVGYPNGVQVVNNQAVFIDPGSSSTVIGPNGSTGKTTFMCVGPGGSTSGTYTATCAPNVNINQCQYTGPTSP